MAGNKCVYFNCGLTRRLNPSIRMYRFPVRDAARCKRWIIHSGNAALADVSEESLKSKMICSNHFNDEFKATYNLPPHAEPMPYVKDDSSEQEYSDDSMEPFDKNKVIKTYAVPSKINSYFPVDIEDSSLHKSPSKDEDQSWLEDLMKLPCSHMGKQKKIDFLKKENEKLKNVIKEMRRTLNLRNTQLRNTQKRLRILQGKKNISQKNPSNNVLIQLDESTT